MASHLSRRATEPDRLLVKVVLTDPVRVREMMLLLPNKLMVSHLSRRATVPDRLLVKVVLVDPVRVREVVLLLSRLTNKLMVSHLFRRARKPLTAEVSPGCFQGYAQFSKSLSMLFKIRSVNEFLRLSGNRHLGGEEKKSLVLEKYI